MKPRAVGPFRITHHSSGGDHDLVELRLRSVEEFMGDGLSRIAAVGAVEHGAGILARVAAAVWAETVAELALGHGCRGRARDPFEGCTWWADDLQDVTEEDMPYAATFAVPPAAVGKVVRAVETGIKTVLGIDRRRLQAAVEFDAGQHPEGSSTPAPTPVPSTSRRTL